MNNVHLDDHRGEINAKMQEFIDYAIDELEGPSQQLAEELLCDLDADLLGAWLFVNRAAILQVAINKRLRARTSKR